MYTLSRIMDLSPSAASRPDGTGQPITPSACRESRRVVAGDSIDLRDRFAGVLVETAIGDALGLPMEGMPASAIARSFPALDRYYFLGRTGFVSDDTEQSALVAQTLARSPRERRAFERAFRRALLGWFLRLPWGIGLGTLRACLRIALGVRPSGVSSAGNGAAMRAAIVGAFFFDAPSARVEWSDALARVTHTDSRAVEGARFVAELAAQCVLHGASTGTADLVGAAAVVVDDRSLRDALGRARQLAHASVATQEAARELGSTGFVVHSIGIAAFSFLRFGDDPGLAIAEAIRAGGDTDSNAAIVGAWMGARHGLRALPAPLVSALHDGPFGPTHLAALALDLERARDGAPPEGGTYSWLVAWARNVALYPVVLLHAFRVLLRR
jgi:ADP-ribosylglycohydrolase